MAARADDEQVGILCLGDEHLRRLALSDNRRDLDAAHARGDFLEPGVEGGFADLFVVRHGERGRGHAAAVGRHRDMPSAARRLLRRSSARPASGLRFGVDGSGYGSVMVVVVYTRPLPPAEPDGGRNDMELLEGLTCYPIPAIWSNATTVHGRVSLRRRGRTARAVHRSTTLRRT
jgi:hypothetical protein